MLARSAIVNAAFSFYDISRAFGDSRRQEAVVRQFCWFLRDFTQRRNVYLVNSGNAAFYLILEALKQRAGRKKVLLPAYSAGSLVSAVKKAGLSVALCDISLDDFGLERNALLKTISADTLAVVAVHLFGIAAQDTAELKRSVPQPVFFIEDCAQAMGSFIGARPAGSIGDISFFSFNRGKNLGLCGGGCITSDDPQLAEGIAKKIKDLKGKNHFHDFYLALQALAFSFAVNPWVYGVGFPLLNFFKDTRPPKDFPVERIAGFCAALGLELEKKTARLFAKRRENARQLLAALRDTPGIILPKVSLESPPVFNRFPLLFSDSRDRKRAALGLWKNGIETSRMYLKPLHWMFELGYGRADFPNAAYLAEHLLALPLHPGLKSEDLSRIIETIRRIQKNAHT